MEHTYLVFAYAVARALMSGQRPVRILDWGGGIGTYGVLAESFFPAERINYTCFDTAEAVSVGRTVLPAGRFTHRSSECLDDTYDLVVASSSLHYFDEWAAIVERLASATDGYLLLSRVPVIEAPRSFVARQRPQVHGASNDFVGWCLARCELTRAFASGGMVVEREFALAESAVIAGAPTQPNYRGFLLRSPRIE